MTSRTVGSWPLIPRRTSSKAGMSGGGGGVGDPRKFSRMNCPRFTGDVRLGFEVIISTAACVSSPPRGLFSGNVTRRNSLPWTSAMP